MIKDLVLYNEALDLKEMGFDEGCITYYFIGGKMSNYFKKVHRNSGLIQQKPYKFHCAVPTYSQAFKWFRYIHNLHAEPVWDIQPRIGGARLIWFFSISQIGNVVDEATDLPHCYSYEEAELDCLKKLIDIVKEKSCVEN